MGSNTTYNYHESLNCVLLRQRVPTHIRSDHTHTVNVLHAGARFVARTFSTGTGTGTSTSTSTSTSTDIRTSVAALFAAPFIATVNLGVRRIVVALRGTLAESLGGMINAANCMHTV